ncbi:hypothetical protein [uncultured Gammaproteobacteria bacterium]|nr:hypothetical protein [uncultured Gammaproteobacteria bacterium]
MENIIFQVFITMAAGLFVAYKCGKSNDCPLSS